MSNGKDSKDNVTLEGCLVDLGEVREHLGEVRITAD